MGRCGWVVGNFPISGGALCTAHSLVGEFAGARVFALQFVHRQCTARLALQLVHKLRKFLALGALADLCREFFDVVENFAFVCHLAEDLSLRVHHRGVVATEGLANFRQR